MNAAQLFKTSERWHFRVLGIFWALCGLFCLGDLVWRSYWWEQKTAWVPVLVGVPFIVGGFGFARRQIWARGCVIPLMLVAGLICLDGLLCGGFTGNRTLVWLSVAGLALAVYTGTFALLSLCNFFRKYV